MKLKSTILFFIFLGFISCKKEVLATKKQEIDTSKVTVKVYSYKELKPLLEQKGDKVYVVNFWATWCAPCVKELPAFEKLKSVYAAKGVEVLLVSLDFPKQINKRVIPFIAKKNLQSKVVLLDNGKDDSWFKAIDSIWSGAIPATLIYTKNKRNFYEQSFDFASLEAELQLFLRD
ncbi:TlpA family protein disulfide reductase [Polaribacter sp.]|nr:TlpA family protein disulfide reductase [Polaribacter sp.]